VLIGWLLGSFWMVDDFGCVFELGGILKKRGKKKVLVWLVVFLEGVFGWLGLVRGLFCLICRGVFGLVWLKYDV